jgi:hypothetical protein
MEKSCPKELTGAYDTDVQQFLNEQKRYFHEVSLQDLGMDSYCNMTYC